MSSVPKLKVNESALYWDPAEVTVPSPPAVAAGDDPMSVMIAAVMPNVADDVAEKVANTRSREERFADKLIAARRAYQNTDGAAEEEFQTAGELVRSTGAAGSGGPASAAGGGSAAGGIGQLGQLMGLPMQMAGAAAALPQSAMQGLQGASDQVGQLASMMGENLTGAEGAELATAASEPSLEEGPEQFEQQAQSEEQDHHDENAAADGENGEPAPELEKQHQGEPGATANPAPEIAL